MDISSIAPKAHVIELKNPAKPSENLGVRVTLQSLNSPEVKTVQRLLQDEALARSKRGRDTTAETLEENGMRLMAAAITNVEFYGDADWKGNKKPKITPEFKLEFLKIEVLKKQIQAGLDEEENFFRA